MNIEAMLPEVLPEKLDEFLALLLNLVEEIDR